nr:MAG TPA: hypothetical protein [Caudoviricetes sp.]
MNTFLIVRNPTLFKVNCVNIPKSNLIIEVLTFYLYINVYLLLHI